MLLAPLPACEEIWTMITMRRILLGSLCREFLGHALAAFCHASELDLVTADHAGVVQNNLAATAHLFLFELDRVSAHASFFDWNRSATAAFNSPRQFAAIIL